MTGRYKDKPDDWKMKKANSYWDEVSAKLFL